MAGKKGVRNKGVMCVEPPRHTEHTDRCRKTEAERNTRPWLPGRASDLSRQMTKPRFGASKTCEQLRPGGGKEYFPEESRGSGFSTREEDRSSLQ